jgi:AcrR family transcriptional regulator
MGAILGRQTLAVDSKYALLTLPSGTAMPSTARPYHHGQLRQAVIDAALQLAEESGDERVSLREVARRIGVSSGAPFRHFANHEALMTAIAEEATLRLRIGVERDLHQAGPVPIDQLKALGHSFLDWALQHPTSFRLVSARKLFDFEGSASLVGHFSAVRALTVKLVLAAQQAGQLPQRPDMPAERMALSLRASAYGLARMHIDGQLPQWGVSNADARQEVHLALDLLVDGLTLMGQGITAKLRP